MALVHLRRREYQAALTLAREELTHNPGSEPARGLVRDLERAGVGRQPSRTSPF